jgi:hypothetical protein
MLWYCAFTWYPQTTRALVAQRVVQQHEAGANHPERIKGWYNLVGGGAGFVLIETDSPDDVTAFTQPYMDLMTIHEARERKQATDRHSATNLYARIRVALDGSARAELVLPYVA